MKLDKVMEKLYLPSQDQILGGLNSNGQVHNVLRGAEQTFQLSQTIEASDAFRSDEGRGDESLGSPNHAHTSRDQEWAQELRRADERAHEMREKYQTLLQTHLQLEQQLKQVEGKIEARDNEIIRLSQLYQGGQNLDKLNLKYHQETNEKVVTKLQSQIDFLNSENHRI